MARPVVEGRWFLSDRRSVDDAGNVGEVLAHHFTPHWVVGGRGAVWRAVCGARDHPEEAWRAHPHAGAVPLCWGCMRKLAPPAPPRRSVRVRDRAGVSRVHVPAAVVDELLEERKP